MMLQRRALFGGKSGWDDPDVFTETTLWLDIRERTLPFMLPFYLKLLKTGVSVDWGDGASDTFDYTGNLSTSHTYAQRGIFLLKISGKTASYNGSVTNGWDGSIFGTTTERDNLGIKNNLVIRARIGSSCTPAAGAPICFLNYVTKCDTVKLSDDVSGFAKLHKLYVRDWIRAIHCANDAGNGTVLAPKMVDVGYWNYNFLSMSNNEFVKYRGSGAYQPFLAQNVICLILEPTITSISAYYGLGSNTRLQQLLIKNEEIVLPYTAGFPSSLVAVHVHNSLVNAYKADSKWGTIANKIVGYSDAEAEEVAVRTMFGYQEPWTCPEIPDI